VIQSKTTFPKREKAAHKIGGESVSSLCAGKKSEEGAKKHREKITSAIEKTFQLMWKQSGGGENQTISKRIVAQGFREGIRGKHHYKPETRKPTVKRPCLKWGEGKARSETENRDPNVPSKEGDVHDGSLGKAGKKCNRTGKALLPLRKTSKRRECTSKKGDRRRAAQY